MLKKIQIAELQPGMFIGDVYNKHGTLLYCANTLIKSENQITTLINQGVSDLYVNIEKSNKSIESSLDESGPTSDHLIYQPEFEEYGRRFQRMNEIHLSTLQTFRTAMLDVKNGKMFSVKKVIDVTEELVDHVISDYDIALTFCQLHDADQKTYYHSINVAIIVSALTQFLGFSKDQVLDAGLGALLHDIGKMKIPEEILKKEGRYTRLEFELMKKHPQYGLEVIGNKNNLSQLTKNIIGQHHERANGSGYPLGLRGKQIDDTTMICALADVYDSLITESAYRDACLPQEALALIFQGAEEEYPRDLVEQLTKMLGIYPVGSFVKLTSGEMGIVIRINRNSLLTPMVLILFDNNCLPLSQPYVRDLSLAKNDSDRELWRIENSLDPKTYKIELSKFIPQPCA